MPEPAGAAAVDALDGPAAPPRANGELVFAAPWERRVFGLAVAVCRTGGREWDDFRRRLIDRIAQDPERPYWASWAAALEDLLAAEDTVPRADVDARAAALHARPHGHDHGR